MTRGHIDMVDDRWRTPGRGSAGIARLMTGPLECDPCGPIAIPTLLPVRPVCDSDRFRHRIGIVKQ